MAMAAGVASLLFLAAVISVAKGPRTGRGVIENYPLPSAIVLAAVGAVALLTTFGLWKKRLWAWWASLVELCAGLAALTLSVALVSPGANDHTDASGMAAMSSVFIAVMVFALLVVLVLPVTRKAFHSPQPG